jgi:2-oxoglutarate ferredoxin oxidoreductase subunit alpha
MGKVYLEFGNHACAKAAIRAGCRFYAGYPITPSSEIAEKMSELLPKVKGKFIQMEDELASMAAAIGASLAGLKSMTATSGPGFSLKQENLGYAYMAEVPVVVVNVQRQGPSTGLPTQPAQGDVMQSRWGTHGDYQAVVFSPSSVQEVYEETIRAFNWAERLRQPVILLIDETIGHMRERLEEPDQVEIWNRKKPSLPPEKHLAYKPEEDDVPVVPNFGEGYRFHVTGLHHGYDGFPTTDPKLVQEFMERIQRKVLRVKDELAKYEEYMIDDADILIVAYGSVSLAAKEAINRLRNEGIKVGLFRPITLWPSPEKRLYELGQKFDKILSVELNMGQYLEEIQRATGRKDIAKLIEVNGRPFSPQDIIDKVKEL